MSESSLGTKRPCTACEAAFYDLGRRPIVCPKCGAAHQPVTRLKSDGRTPPKGRIAPKPQPVVAAAALAKFLTVDPQIVRTINHARAQRGLKALR